MSKAQDEHSRKGITIKALFRMFPDNKSAEACFVEQRWSEGIKRPHCGHDQVLTTESRKSMPYRCKDYKNCGKRFSAKTSTVVEYGKIGYQDWLIAGCMPTTNLKSVSRMKLHREFGIARKSAWFLAHRLRKAFEDTGRSAAGKTAVIGMKDRATNELSASADDSADADILQSFAAETTEESGAVYTDDARSCNGVKQPHESVKHSVGEHVNGMAPSPSGHRSSVAITASSTKSAPSTCIDMSTNLLSAQTSEAMTPLNRCSRLSETWMASSCLVDI